VYLVPGNTLTSTQAELRQLTNLAANTASAYITPAVASATSKLFGCGDECGCSDGSVVRADAAGTPYTPEVTGVSGALDATAGSRISASVLSSFIFPRSVAGSQAPAAFTTSAVSVSIDKNPPSGP